MFNLEFKQAIQCRKSFFTPAILVSYFILFLSSYIIMIDIKFKKNYNFSSFLNGVAGSLFLEPVDAVK